MNQKLCPKEKPLMRFTKKKKKWGKNNGNKYHYTWPKRIWTLRYLQEKVFCRSIRLLCLLWQMGLSCTQEKAPRINSMSQMLLDFKKQEIRWYIMSNDVNYIKDCPKCNGSGEMDCPSCGGSGYDYMDGGQCDRCDGTGDVTCNRCHGSGVVSA